MALAQRLGERHQVGRARRDEDDAVVRGGLRPSPPRRPPRTPPARRPRPSRRGNAPRARRRSPRSGALPFGTPRRIRGRPSRRWTSQAPVAASCRQRHSHGGQPMSSTIRQTPSGSSRQVEWKVPVRLPSGSNTGPLLRASVPESITSTSSGAQAKGAFGPFEEGLPALGDGLASPAHRPAHEDRLLGDEGREGRVIAIGHRPGERRLARPHRRGERRRSGRGRGRGRWLLRAQGGREAEAENRDDGERPHGRASSNRESATSERHPRGSPCARRGERS